MNCYKDALKIGQVVSAMIALAISLRFKLFGGYNLALLSTSLGDGLKLTVS